mgnify:CR=1 FL=1
MPQALVDKVRESEKFNQGYATVEYLAAAILDMELHTQADGAFDPVVFEREALARIGMPREIADDELAQAVVPDRNLAEALIEA